MSNRLWLALSLLVPITSGLSSQPAGADRGVQRIGTTRVSPAARLNVAQFQFDDELDAAYQREYERLAAMCPAGTEHHACRVKSLRPVAKLVAVVHNAPSEASEVVGGLYAVMGFHPDYDLGYSLEFRPHQAVGRAAVWLDSVGDWGYGIEISGVGIKGDWIQLFGPPLPADSWIDSRSASFSGQAGSIQGGLMSLPAVRATFPGGERRLIAPGNYKIERIRGSQVTFREEVPSDFPCGEDVKPPATMPPSLRTTAQDLFSPTGEPLFSESYSRGC